MSEIISKVGSDSGVNSIELLSSPIEIPNSLSWNASSGHTEGSLTQDIRNFDFVVSTVALFVTSYTPSNQGHPSWQNASVWTNQMVEESVTAGTSNWYKYMGTLPNILPGDPKGTLDSNYFSWHIAFGMKNATTIRINQSVVTGWSTDSTNKIKLISVRGIKL